MSGAEIVGLAAALCIAGWMVYETAAPIVRWISPRKRGR